MLEFRVRKDAGASWVSEFYGHSAVLGWWDSKATFRDQTQVASNIPCGSEYFFACGFKMV